MGRNVDRSCVFCTCGTIVEICDGAGGRGEFEVADVYTVGVDCGELLWGFSFRDAWK